MLIGCRTMLPACEATTTPIPVATLVEPSPLPGSRPGKEDEVLDSEISSNGTSSFTANAASAAVAVFGSRCAHKTDVNKFLTWLSLARATT